MAGPLQVEEISRARLEAQFGALLEEFCIAHSRIDKFIKAEGRADLTPLAETLIGFAQLSRDDFNAQQSDQQATRGKAQPEDLNSHQSDLQAALLKIQREWMNLHPLVDQRCPEESPNHLAPQLSVADAIANDCLRLGGSPARCMTVFGMMFDMSIRYASTVYEDVYPRVPTMMIPLANRRDPWLWMGIGHEIGHYIWDHSNLKTILPGSLANQIIGLLNQGKLLGHDQLSQWNEWLEEVFADIFGVLILGPAFTRSFVAWLSSTAPQDKLLENDHDHALPLLRPLIQLWALRELENFPTSRNAAASQPSDYVTGETPSVWQEVFGLAAPLAEGSDTFGTTEILQEWLGFLTRLAPDKALDYWLDQVIGETLVRDYLYLIPGLVQEVVEIFLSSRSVNYYTQETHARVMRIVQTLSDDKGTAAREDLSSEALSISVAWYAWEQVINSRLKEKGRNQRLDKIRKFVWGEEIYANLYCEDTTWPPGTLNEALAQQRPLLQEKNQMKNKKAIAKRLRESEFSAREDWCCRYCNW
ncbi:MAG: hypothetical protein Fur0044_02170 [Anaerolineae bacterium]